MIFGKDYWKHLKEEARWNANDDYKREKLAYRVSKEDREKFVKERYNFWISLLVNAHIKADKEVKVGNNELTKKLDEIIKLLKENMKEKNM